MHFEVLLVMLTVKIAKASSVTNIHTNIFNTLNVLNSLESNFVQVVLASISNCAITFDACARKWGKTICCFVRETRNKS